MSGLAAGIAALLIRLEILVEMMSIGKPKPPQRRNRKPIKNYRYPLSLHFSLHVRPDPPVSAPLHKPGGAASAELTNAAERLSDEGNSSSSSQRADFVWKSAASGGFKARSGREFRPPHPHPLAVAAPFPTHPKSHGQKDHQKVMVRYRCGIY